MDLATIKKYITLFSIIFLVMACQESVPETIITDTGNDLDANSKAASLMKRTVLKDGSLDNIIDNANCLTIVLPIEVTANGTLLTITDVNDFQLIENIFEQSDIDTDNLEIQYPIDVILTDYTVVTVTSSSDLQNLASTCLGENVVDEDIECIDFEYPITFNVLDQGGSIPMKVVIQEDNELFQFLENLEDKAAVNFSFPIIMVDFNGTQFDIDALDTLETIIESAENSCDEDDDFDYNDDDENVLLDFLTNGDWIIDEFIVSDEGFTDNYEGYIFRFSNNGDIDVSNGSQYVSGSFSIDNSDPNNLILILDFGSVAPFDALNNDWRITETEVDSLALEIGNEANGDLQILIFEKL